MALKNNNMMNMADGGNTHDRSKLRMQKLKKAEPKQPELRMQKLNSSEALNEARKALKPAVTKAREIARPTAGNAKPITRPATPARPRKPSAGLNPVKPVTQTQGRKKNDPWNSPW